MIIKKLTLMLAVIVIAACTRLQVTSDWDSSVDFTPLRSYVLLPNETPDLNAFALLIGFELNAAIAIKKNLRERLPDDDFHEGNV